MKKNILLTGGTGFIGQALGRFLVQKGYTIRVICRNPSKVLPTLSYPCEAISWQDQSYRLPKGVFEDVFAVVNLAGEPIAEKSWSSEQKKRIVDSRVLPTRKLVQAIQDQNPSSLKVFIQGSAVGYYGDQGDQQHSESDPPGKTFLADVCRQWEREAAPLADRFRCATLRTGMVLGMGGGALQKLNQVYAAGLGANIGAGRNWVSWIHLEDLVHLIVWILEHDHLKGPVNAVSPEPIPFADLHRELAHIFGVPAWPRIPALVPRLTLGERAALFLESQRVLPSYARSHRFSFAFPQLRDALENIYGSSRDNGVIHALYHQWFPQTPQEIWPFFAAEKNLETITPPWLNFHVRQITPSTEIRHNTLIDYRLRLHGIPLHWRTRISEWQPPLRFVDEQEEGPFKIWHHTHSFAELGGGTLMTDHIQYKVPVPILGPLVSAPFVNADVEKIFQWRRQKLGSLFRK